VSASASSISRSQHHPPPHTTANTTIMASDAALEDTVPASHTAAILQASAKHPLVPGVYKYGTAGFRMHADLLDGVTFRVGLLASLRSRYSAGQTIGVMITASHNPAVDNGVKTVDPLGEMMDMDWEVLATDLVNAKSDEELVQVYKSIAKSKKIKMEGKAKVIYGRDTRPSGHTLARALEDALKATDTQMVDYKLLTTPQLHYLVRATNTENTPVAYGKVSEVGYYEKLAEAFTRALYGHKIKDVLQVDCANGVGAVKMAKFMEHIDQEKTDFQVKLVNDDVVRPELLNLDCGADFVKTKQRAPPNPKPQPGVRCCSFDGDADRLMYYWTDPQQGFVMLDGDRIATLAAKFISDLLDRAGLRDELRMCVVQTAYANGGSTAYIGRHLKLPVICTPTGVKHLHHVAQQYDVGIYFEANGHGTVLFSPDAVKLFNTTAPQTIGQKDAMNILAALSDMINQTVGDAFSDLLLVELILAHNGWNLRDWAGTYQDFPNRLVRVEVRDKDAFRTTDAERRLTHPEGAQEEIDAAVKKYPEARAFARASGTENACRVYAEASSPEYVVELANAVTRIIQRYGGMMQ